MIAGERYSEIRRVQEWLAKFSRDTGEEFLQLGSALEQCHDLSRQTLEIAGKVLALANGSDADSPVSKAHVALSAAVAAIGSEVGRYTGISDELREALHELQRIEKLNNALTHSIRPFQYIRLCYGIEAARLDAQSQRDLAALRGSMTTLQERSIPAYESQAERLKEAKKVVVLLGGWVVERVKALSSAGGHTHELLNGMKAVPGHISVVTEHLVQGMELIGGKTVELVVSLQADDDVRQRLGHVGAMLDEIAERLQGLSADGDRAAGDDEACWFVHEASAIQLRQVSEIRRKVGEAGARITTALGEMVERVATISSEAMTLTTSAAETSRQQSTVTQLNLALESLYACFSGPPLKDDEIFARMQAVMELTETIVEMAQDMKLLSINAQIRAAQLSEMQSISVLGEHARHISDENLKVAGEVNVGLTRLTDLMNRFTSDISAIAEVQKSQQAELQVVSGTFVQECSEVRRRVSSELGAVCEQCSALQQRTLQLLNGIHFIGAADEGFQAMAKLLEGIVRDTDTGLTADLVGSESRGLLDAFREKYTMEIEHLLHDGVAVSGAAAPVPNVVAGDREFGDNVELF